MARCAQTAAQLVWSERRHVRSREGDGGTPHLTGAAAALRCLHLAPAACGAITGAAVRARELRLRELDDFATVIASAQVRRGRVGPRRVLRCAAAGEAEAGHGGAPRRQRGWHEGWQDFAFLARSVAHDGRFKEHLGFAVGDGRVARGHSLERSGPLVLTAVPSRLHGLVVHV